MKPSEPPLAVIFLFIAHFLEIDKVVIASLSHHGVPIFLGVLIYFALLGVVAMVATAFAESL